MKFENLVNELMESNMGNGTLRSGEFHVVPGTSDYMVYAKNVKTQNLSKLPNGLSQDSFDGSSINRALEEIRNEINHKYPEFSKHYEMVVVRQAVVEVV